MPVESATYISQLDVTKPAGSDLKAEGDDHVRLLKASLKATFPNFTAAALNATQAQIDKLVTTVVVNPSAPANSATVDASGRIGIGVTGSMFYAFNIYTPAGGNNSSILIETGGNRDAAFRSKTSLGFFGSGTSIDTFSNCWNVYDFNRGAECMRFDSSGNLLVGINSGSFHTIRGSGVYALSIVQPNTNGNVLLIDGTAGTSQNLVVFSHGGSVLGTITTNGTTTSYNTSSDYRLKNITGQLTGSGAFIDALKPVQGTWKSDGSPFVGFLAHEFQAVSPSSVTGEKDAVDEDGNPIYQAMQASSPEVMANIVAELQSLRARVAALEAA